MLIWRLYSTNEKTNITISHILVRLLSNAFDTQYWCIYTYKLVLTHTTLGQYITFAIVMQSWVAIPWHVIFIVVFACSLSGVCMQQRHASPLWLMCNELWYVCGTNIFCSGYEHNKEINYVKFRCIMFFWGRVLPWTRTA